MPKKQSAQAFSLTELAFVILIIAVILVAILKSSSLIGKSRIAKATTLTKYSPISDTKDMVLWLESALDSSFLEKEREDYESLSAQEISLNKGLITKWYDRNPHSGPKKNGLTYFSSAPKYKKNCINYLPCLDFSSGSSFLTLMNTTDIAMSDYSIFIVEQKKSSDPMPIIGSTSNNNSQESLEIGYLSADTIYWSHGNNSSQINFQSSELDNYKPKIHSFINSRTANNPKYYLNGNEVIINNPFNSDNFFYLKTTAFLEVGVSSYGISSAIFYNGYLGEIIVIPYKVSHKDHVEIISYLSKKWSIDL